MAASAPTAGRTRQPSAPPSAMSPAAEIASMTCPTRTPSTPNQACGAARTRGQTGE